jgi:hypothetical protein
MGIKSFITLDQEQLQQLEDQYQEIKKNLSVEQFYEKIALK